uniref:Nucleoside diphosphate kinase n=1 Tax=Lotus japonicus TaxID=34305 RepID=I3T159_LOTJA|nr:unknown [Lotus japonicus]
MAGNSERTFIMVKPDGVQRGIVGDILRRFEQRGYKLVGLKLLQAPRALLESHYEEHKGKKFYEPLLSYIGSGPVVAMVWEGLNVISVGRKMLGATDPAKSEPGTIRGDYAIVTGRNIVHGSDSEKAAQREIDLWFRAEELANWSLTVNPWIYE